MTEAPPTTDRDHHRRRTVSGRDLRDLVKYIGMFFVWNIGISLAIIAGFLLKMELLGYVLGLLLAVWIARGYLLGGRGSARRRALIRPRPLSPVSLRWLLLAVPVFILATWSLTEVWRMLVPVPGSSMDQFKSLTTTVEGKIAISLVAVTLAPLMEEFFFRGLIQGVLVRQNGATVGILTTAAAFAAVHLLPWVFPILFLIGAACGYAVYVTRSIWAGVILHTANNLAALPGVIRDESPRTAPTIWTTGLTSDWWLVVGALILSIVALVYLARGLREAARLRPRATLP